MYSFCCKQQSGYKVSDVMMQIAILGYEHIVASLEVYQDLWGVDKNWYDILNMML